MPVRCSATVFHCFGGSEQLNTRVVVDAQITSSPCRLLNTLLNKLLNTSLCVCTETPMTTHNAEYAVKHVCAYESIVITTYDDPKR